MIFLSTRKQVRCLEFIIYSRIVKMFKELRSAEEVTTQDKSIHFYLTNNRVYFWFDILSNKIFDPR